MKLWLSGGTVRDHLLNMPKSNDVDFAVEAESYDAMKEALVARGLKIWQERPEYVTLRGQLPAAALDPFGFAGLLPLRGVLDADFTLCRAETMYSDRRHPDKVTPATIREDLARRDFTINAVAISEDGVWLDPHSGKLHASQRLLRTVGDPLLRFDEDPLRMLRAFRFTVTHGLRVHWTLNDALNHEKLTALVATLPVERVQVEMLKAFKADWLHSAQLLSYDMSGLGEQVRLHFPKLWLKATIED